MSTFYGSDANLFMKKLLEVVQLVSKVRACFVLTLNVFYFILQFKIDDLVKECSRYFTILDYIHYRIERLVSNTQAISYVYDLS